MATSEHMNEQNFTNRLEASLTRGMDSVPLPALEPASARYRIAPPKVGRRLRMPLTVAIAAIGLALCASLVGAAASGTSPAPAISEAIHHVVVLVRQISFPAEPARGAPSPDPASGPTDGSQPPAAEQSSAPAPTAEPTPVPAEEPTPPPTVEATPASAASQPADASLSPSPDPVESPAPTP